MYHRVGIFFTHLLAILWELTNWRLIFSFGCGKFYFLFWSLLCSDNFYVFSVLSFCNSIRCVLDVLDWISGSLTSSLIFGGLGGCLLLNLLSNFSSFIHNLYIYFILTMFFFLNIRALYYILVVPFSLFMVFCPCVMDVESSWFSLGILIGHSFCTVFCFLNYISFLKGQLSFYFGFSQSCCNSSSSVWWFLVIFTYIRIKV